MVLINALNSKGLRLSGEGFGRFKESIESALRNSFFKNLPVPVFG